MLSAGEEERRMPGKGMECPPYTLKMLKPVITIFDFTTPSRPILVDSKNDIIFLSTLKGMITANSRMRKLLRHYRRVCFGALKLVYQPGDIGLQNPDSNLVIGMYRYMVLADEHIKQPIKVGHCKMGYVMEKLISFEDLFDLSVDQFVLAARTEPTDPPLEPYTCVGTFHFECKFYLFGYEREEIASW